MHSRQHRFWWLTVRILGNGYLGTFEKGIEPTAQFAKAFAFRCVSKGRHDICEDGWCNNHGSDRLITRQQGRQFEQAALIQQCLQYLVS